MPGIADFKKPPTLLASVFLRDTLHLRDWRFVVHELSGTHNAMIANKQRRYPGNNKRQGFKGKNDPPEDF